MKRKQVMALLLAGTMICGTSTSEELIAQVQEQVNQWKQQIGK